MNIAANAFVFIAALALGGFSSWLVPTGTTADPNSLTAYDLVGTWKGNFGRNSGECTIEITRADGDFVYGTLEKEGALVRFEGYYNLKTRKLYFEETSVLRLAAHMGEWSLGRNSAVVSADGRTLTGNGYDRWGHYHFSASNH